MVSRGFLWFILLFFGGGVERFLGLDWIGWKEGVALS